MLLDDFWATVESARSDADQPDGRFAVAALAEALTARLSTLPLDDWDAVDTRQKDAAPEPPRLAGWDGRFGGPGDRELIPERLPRLVALFSLGDTTRLA